MANKNKQLGCGYQGSHFGAWYDDACCRDRYLWDLDSGGIDDAGNSYLDIGGDIPCPQCNTKQYVKSYLADSLFNSGYESFEHPLPLNVVKHPLCKWPSSMRRMGARYWRAGRREALKDAMQEG